MAIVRSDKKMSIRTEGVRGFSEGTWHVQCDQKGCKNQSVRGGTDHGEAADFARRQGFTTQFKSDLDPATWCCTSCQTPRIKRPVIQQQPQAA